MSRHPAAARVLVLIGLLAVPVLLALASQALAARPGAPDVTDPTPVRVSQAGPDAAESADD
ncbi:hypothetical protein K8W59_15860 [Nocardioides rotundus]|uniref:hypothetical protein n=1 Tax=Nocardioides rotundus TaxID=1774216 RepID=UPI001CC138D9|nr:hypothetical protein [Nocardioides rotundus]UAL29233.1 hypothetical protein K8W59_15860 [Nocardioides rotundus]